MEIASAGLSREGVDNGLGPVEIRQFGRHDLTHTLQNRHPGLDPGSRAFRTVMQGSLDPGASRRYGRDDDENRGGCVILNRP